MAKSHQHIRHSHHPLPDIQIVRRLIEQYAASFSIPGSSPSGRLIISLGPIPIADDPAKSFDISQHPNVQIIFKGAKKLACPLVEHYSKSLATIMCICIHYLY